MKKTKARKFPYMITLLSTLAVMLLVITFFWPQPTVLATTEIGISIDGQRIDGAETPIIQNSRTLVPIRIISEELGAEVTWNNAERSVFIKKGNRSVLLRIDRNLIEYSKDDISSYDLSDVTPKIISGRTFVPIRLIGNALGVGIQWDEKNKAVLIDSKKESAVTPFFDMQISSVKESATIEGTTLLKTRLPASLPTGATQIKYLLLDPKSGSGFLLAKGSNLAGSYQWQPRVRDLGEKILVSALYDSKSTFLAGDAIAVRIAIKPNVVLSGVSENQSIKGSVKLASKINFSAAYVKYQIKNTETGKSVETAEQDPAGTYQWSPIVGFNGNVSIKAIAYDEKKQAYPGQSVSVTVEIAPVLTLGGVKDGQAVNTLTTLSASRNFDVLDTEYRLRDTATGAEKSLGKLPYGSIAWFPGLEDSGNKQVYVRVTGTDGKIYDSKKISVSLSGSAKILLQGAGPGQMITTAAPAKMKVASNVDVSAVKYVMTNIATGKQIVLAEGQEGSREFVYKPVSGQDGTWKLKAIASYGNNRSISSAEVNVTVYSGKIYPPKAIVEKTEFQEMASELAIADWKKSGMSAALQTAQAILESGWGQSVPVDKYSGKFSNNLFGIKGSGAAGTVISNTWEEYNGVKYRIDDKFRAYYNVSQSWTDHNKLLMTAARYEPYRNVMYDSSLGAWALKRCGYATDSKYPVKLIDLIELYHLEELDRISI